VRRPSTRNLVIGIVAVAVAVAVVATAILVPAVAPPPTAGAFTVTILHNNDGESQLAGAPADPAYGGIARFATLVRSLQEAAVRDTGSGAVTVSSGDNYLAGPQFAASLEKGPPFHDSVGLDRIGYDALAIGNHDAAGAAQVTDEDGTVTAPGARVQEVVLDDGTVVVSGGTVVDGPGVSIATNDFSARGGDSWPFREVPFTSIGVSYQQAMADYLADGLAGSITAQAYPEAGSGRITRLN
jgi:hypothetical protein